MAVQMNEMKLKTILAISTDNMEYELANLP